MNGESIALVMATTNISTEEKKYNKINQADVCYRIWEWELESMIFSALVFHTNKS